MMKEIPLTQGKVASVDDCDYEYLNQWKWHPLKSGKTFYAVRNSGSRGKVFMHNEIGLRAGLKHHVDHKDRDGLNNRRSNLRSATHKQNCENFGLRKDNISGCKGVSWDKQLSKWRARIKHNYKTIHLGVFEDLDDAIAARKKAERKYFTHA